MPRFSLKTITLAFVAASAMLSPVLFSAAAEAKGAKEYYAQSYIFTKPMKGYEGFSGAYHCSYVKTPKTICVRGKCKKVWELLQTCQ